MPDTKLPITFQLPDRKSIEAYVVRRPDGSITVRTKQELAPAPARPKP